MGNGQCAPKSRFARARGKSLKGDPGASSPGKILKFGPLRMHFLHSGARIRVLISGFFIQRDTCT